MKRTQYFKWGLTAFLTVCAVLVFYDTFYQAGTQPACLFFERSTPHDKRPLR